MNEMGLRSCSACGKQVPREDMFGAEPDLLCESCAHGLRERLTPKATGRLASTFGGRPTPLTVSVLAISAGLFLLEYVIFKGKASLFPAWFWRIQPYGPQGNIGTGDWWRLITSAVLHGGVLHILFNSMWIWSLGRAVEGTRGTWRFLAIFIGSAAISSAAQWYFRAEPAPPPYPLWFFKGAGVGLSGVLYGLAGFLWMRRKVDAVAAMAMNPSTTRVLGGWFVICILIPALKVANWGHAGGLVFGLAAGWISLQPGPRRKASLAGLALLTILAIVWVSTGHRLRI